MIVGQKKELLDRTLHELRVHQTELEAQNRELRESREELEASRARYADLFDFAPVSYLTLDRVLRVLEINLTGAALLGHERSAALGKPLRSLVRFDLDRPIFNHTQACLAQGQTVKAEFGFVRKRDEAHVFVQAVTAPIIGSDGTTLGFRTALCDVTERRMAELRLEQSLDRERAAREGLEQARVSAEKADHLKDEFLSVVSHELRTPLNAILGWAQLLLAGPVAEWATVRRGLEVIRRNAEAQRRLVEDLLDVSRIVSGKLRVELQPASLEAIVHAAVESIEPTAVAKKIELAIDVRARPRVMADAERLKQAVCNLLSNAIKFSKAEGRVDVVIEARDETALVRVRDTGVGIEPSALPWIFERFRQVDSSSRRQHGGLGLGLAIARHIVQEHGGDVSATSEGPGRGSTFAIEVPLAPAGVRESAPPWLGEDVNGVEGKAPREKPELRLSGVYVLVVDDEEDARNVAAMMLQAAGASVAVAASAEAALSSLAARPPCVLVSDLGMPREDGFSLIAKVREMPPPAGRVRAVALTAFARNEDVSAALAAGYDAHLAKPVKSASLVETVATMAGTESTRPVVASR